MVFLALIPNRLRTAFSVCIKRAPFQEDIEGDFSSQINSPVHLPGCSFLPSFALPSEDEYNL
ncbi:hypothetical protein V7O66_02080 [Methanolobus sp. ZRKC3]|uniref:hypothetical protein n=1 Tax=Methanolobus sp. ZRKC3 TaxID=3125786 RepID=UPI0032548808